MRILSLSAALLLCLPTNADVRLKARTSVAGDSFSSTILVKGSRQRVESEKYEIITLYQCDLHRMVQLNPKAKTYRLIPLDQPAASSPARSARSARSGGVLTFTTTFADTGAKQKLRGMVARRFTAETHAEANPNSCSSPANINISTMGWYADIPGSDLSCADAARASLRLRRTDPQCSDRTVYQLKGSVPAGLALSLETTMTTSSGPVITKQETLALEQTALSADLFDIPEGYRLVRTEEEFVSLQTTPPSVPAAEAIASSRPARSTRSGEPRPTLTRIGLRTVVDPASGKGIEWTPIQLGRQLNAQGFESVPLDSVDLTKSGEASAGETCAYWLTVKVKGSAQGTDAHERPGSQETDVTPESVELSLQAELQAKGEATPIWSGSLESEAGETREHFFERVAKVVATEIRKRELHP